MTKRQRIEAYLDRLAPEQLRNLTVREITSDLPSEGLEVTERYVKHILDQRRPAPSVPAAGEWPPQPPPMTGTEPRRPATRGRLRPVPDPDRQPPHNLEAEEAVLGAVLTAGRLLAEVAACSRRPTSTGQPTGPSGGPSSAWPTAASPPTR